ncbi:S1 family peptidase [Ferruginibacter sp.]
MDDILLMDAVERYLRGEMSEQERTMLEELRKNNPEVDQMVVEHTYFLNELDQYGAIKNFKHALVEAEIKLTDEGVINPAKLQGRAKVAFLWKRYKRIAAVAASIAGIVSIITAGLTSVYNNSGDKTNPGYEQLKRDLTAIKEDQKKTKNEVNDIKTLIGDARPKSGGTGFLIDGQGYLITNAHVLQGKTIIATNDKGRQFLVTVCMQDNTRDIAVLKIDDKDFVPYKSLPYSIGKSVNLAEPVYTMGFPKDGIVYGEGYLSSETGFQNDTLSYQIAITADHGNSGGPVLNKNGDVIGILSDKSAGGGVYAVKSMYIFKTIENLKKDTAFSNIKLASANTIKNLDREQQVKKVTSCVFLIKSYE